ncbi:MAG TPA: aldehyde dehydrogenase family protein [Dehalococcoidia bacterium]|jgi:aldehyde dehydrogenase (NAD+)|nr:aldehyde dehydrogenase family protein [Dehalococcoidia bacterium]HBJ31497.1 aldehyde dehydrogenase family protein [Dehalococcoidia bacterium]HCH08602.1 aldehyde dehydrogenase family protein [Dehalococcoidia bacterium]
MGQLTTYQNYIDGQWSDSVSGETYTITNPAHKSQVLGRFQRSNNEDAVRAIEAARNALDGWASTPAPQRAAILFKALQLIEERGDELARSITIEEGKPIGDAMGEVKRSMNITEYAAGEGRRMFGNTTPSELPNTVAYTSRRPLGVVGIITPWNFPLAIPAWKIAPALICGNTLVFKPASATPMTAVALTKIFEDAGLPPGVLNLVTGPGGSVGNTIVDHPDVSGVSFTGSTEVGTALYTRATQTLKKVQAEMGGKNAVIVLEDADMDSALGGIVQGAFGSTGQRCTATSRVVVQESVYDAFMTELIERTSKLTVGDGLDPAMDIAPLSSQSQFNTVMEYIGIGAEEGATIAYGGNPRTEGDLDEGYYVEPTIFTNVDTNMRIAQEEIFGPVLTVFKAADLEEAVSITNNVKFGLSSSIYTMDIPQAFRYIDTVETGIVHVNSPTLGGEVHLPFGGMKESGVGTREQGTEAINFFTEPVTVYIDYSSAARAQAKFI